jgi:GGDEF domain-containing protein
VNPALSAAWFPLALGATLGAALLRTRACWAVTAFALAGWFLAGYRQEQLTALAGLPVLAGAAGLVGATWITRRAMLHWDAGPKPAAAEPEPRPEPAAPAGERVSIAALVEQFGEWLATHRGKADPWPDFGEFLRSSLVVACGARHIRAYRMLAADEEQLTPLRLTEPGEHDFPSTHEGIVGEVLRSGTSYFADSPNPVRPGEALGASVDDHCAWCFAVKHQNTTIGLVRVAGVDPAIADRQRLIDLEGIVNLFWIVLTESCRARLIGFMDPVTGALSHRAFMDSAERTLEEAYAAEEPVAIVAVAIEGLRTLCDRGQWELANQTAFEVSLLLRERLREDDELGVFDGSRFLLLLRRVEPGLAGLITTQLLERITPLLAQRSRGGTELAIRCGVAGSGKSREPLQSLVARATACCLDARRRGLPLMIDHHSAPEAAAP